MMKNGMPEGFYNRFSEIKATLSRDGIESYIPMKTRSYPQPDGEVVIRRVPLVAMLMFLRCMMTISLP